MGNLSVEHQIRIEVNNKISFKLNLSSAFPGTPAITCDSATGLGHGFQLLLEQKELHCRVKWQDSHFFYTQIIYARVTIVAAIHLRNFPEFCRRYWNMGPTKKSSWGEQPNRQNVQNGCATGSSPSDLPSLGPLPFLVWARDNMIISYNILVTFLLFTNLK